MLLICTKVQSPTHAPYCLTTLPPAHLDVAAVVDEAALLAVGLEVLAGQVGEAPGGRKGTSKRSTVTRSGARARISQWHATRAACPSPVEGRVVQRHWPFSVCHPARAAQTPAVIRVDAAGRSVGRRQPSRVGRLPQPVPIPGPSGPLLLPPLLVRCSSNLPNPNSCVLLPPLLRFRPSGTPRHMTARRDCQAWPCKQRDGRVVLSGPLLLTPSASGNESVLLKTNTRTSTAVTARLLASLLVLASYTQAYVQWNTRDSMRPTSCWT